MAKPNVQLVATFQETQTFTGRRARVANVATFVSQRDKPGQLPCLRIVTHHVRLFLRPEQRLVCTCKDVRHRFDETGTAAPPGACWHIERLYANDLKFDHSRRVTVTEFGHNLFDWRWAQRLLEITGR